MLLDRKAKIVIYSMLSRKGIGLPTAVGALDAWIFKNPYYLLFPIPFIAIIYITWLFAPIGLGLRSGELHIVRRVGHLIFSLDDIKTIKPITKLRENAGWVVRTGGSGGAWGYFGYFWSKKWGHFKIHATDDKKFVVVEQKNGEKILVSPDKKDQFIESMKKFNNSIIIS